MSVAIYYLYLLFLDAGMYESCWIIGIAGYPSYPPLTSRDFPCVGCPSVADLHSETSSLLE